MTLPDDERLLDLLAADATEGLGEAEHAELEAARREAGESWDELEYAAAALDVAWTGAHEPLRGDLRARILTDFQKAHARPEPEAPVFSLARFAAVAAAAVLVGLLSWWLVGDDGPRVDGPAALRAKAGTIVAPWSKPDDPRFAKVRGEVVWNDAEQRGYMVLTGMPRNDPRARQYQLWIVDPDRDKRPVDGGVFDVRVDGLVVVPIDAKLAVDKPAAFAITLEKPGGVVVSDGPLLVVAPVAG